VRRELLTREMDARSAERGQYAFVQALIREVAYNTLSKKDRKKLHLSAARYFESLGNDELAGVLASHYLSAHANASEGEEASALAGQARIALKAAATRASALGSFDQAIGFLEQALEITDVPAEKFDVLIRTGEDLFTIGRLNECEDKFRAALDLATELGDRHLMLLASVRLASAFGGAYKADEALALVTPLLDTYADGDEVLLAEARLTLSRNLYRAGKFHESLSVLEPALEVFERRGELKLIGFSLISRANSLWSTFRRRESVAIGEYALALALEHGLVDVELRIRGNLANLLTESNAHGALEAWHELIARARKLGQRAMVLNGIGNFGYSSYVAGEWDAALAEMDSALAEDLSARDRLLVESNALLMRASRGESVAEGIAELQRIGQELSGNWQLFLGDAQGTAALALGDLKTARDKFIFLSDADPGTAFEYVYRAVRPALWARDVEDARQLFERYEQIGAFGQVADARRATMRAGIAALEGRPKEALALYAEALRGWRNATSDWDEALTGIDMAELLDPSEPEVAAAVSSTRAILERLRARPYLERLEAAVSSAGHPSARAAGAHSTEANVREVALTE
jgi:tetratricopeptide (TPR) repeat protein